MASKDEVRVPALPRPTMSKTHCAAERAAESQGVNEANRMLTGCR